ncbi:MAG: PEGA domain-containing protein, partial [Bdellovibrionales bacterium]|nr:PEGA domain-containing protein [Bdellovibrionales bacterium]
RYQTADELHRDLNRFLNQNYPDFSPQDFGIFVTEHWVDEREKLRDRMVEYAQLRIERKETEEDTLVEDQKTEITTTQEAEISRNKKNTEIVGGINFSNGPSAIGNALLAAQSEKLNNTKSATNAPETRSPRLELKTISPQQEKSVARSPFSNHQQQQPGQPKNGPQKISPQPSAAVQAPSFAQAANTGSHIFEVDNLAKRGGHLSSSQGNTPKPFDMGSLYEPAAQSSPWVDRIMTFAILTLFTLGSATLAALYMRSHPESMATIEPIRPWIAGPLARIGLPLPAPRVVTQQTSSSSIDKPSLIKVLITSDPSGADIYIDGKPVTLADASVARTPHELSIEQDKNVTIDLLRNGYARISKKVTFTEPAQTFNETLKRTETGYLNLEVRSSSPDISIYINGEPLLMASPVKNLPVPAGKLEVRAVDNFTQYSDFQTMEIRPESRADMVLILKRTQTEQEKRLPSSSATPPKKKGAP